MRRSVGLFAAVFLAALVGAIGFYMRGAGRSAPPAPTPPLTTTPTPSPPPTTTAPAVVAPAASPTPAPAAPVTSAPTGSAAPASLLSELGAVLEKHGYKKPIAIVDSRVSGDRLTLTMSPRFAVAAQDLTALDELVAALSASALEKGYRHLELRVQKDDGSVVPLDALVATPPARRPQPDPIDDGVRR